MKLYEFGGSGQPLVLSVGNGFPPETYQHLLERFTTDYRVVCVLPRPLWDNPPPPESLDSWQDMTHDLRDAMHQFGLEGGIGIGHSMGGVATLYAARAEPSIFEKIVLLDPTIMPPTFLLMMRVMRAIGLTEQFPPVKGARRRRDSFESVEAAYQHWRQKPLFDSWPEESIRAYAESLTTPDGSDGVTLAWSKDWEARYYATIETHTWRDIPDVAGTLPALFIQGQTSDAYMEASYERMKGLWPEATHQQIKGHGHLFPMSAPEEAAILIDGWLRDS